MTSDYRPAGFSDDEEFEDYEGFYFEKTEKQKNLCADKKSEFEQFADCLMDHLKNNDVNKLRETLDQGISTGFDIDSALSGEWSLLFYACSLSLPEAVLFLADERGANLDRRIEGETPLMIACSTKIKSDNVLKVVEILIEIEPRLLNRTNYLGENALMLAALSGHLDVVNYLIKAGESYDIISNSGRNVLYYAIEGNHIDIVKLLLDMKIDLDILDCYGTSVRNFAQECNALDILELLPAEEDKYEIPSAHFSYNSFDSLLPTVLKNETNPSYFPDIVTMLRGMDCEDFISNFSEEKMSLEEFLTIDEKRLEEIGITMPFQRKMILFGLHKFFKGKWTNKSIYIPENIRTNITPIDHIYIFTNLLRQTIILKSQLVYLKKLKALYGINFSAEQLSVEQFISYSNRIIELLLSVEVMKVTKRPLLIEKQDYPIESNVIKKSAKEQNSFKKIFLPLTVAATIMAKLFLSK